MGHKKNELFMRYFSPLFPLPGHTVLNILPAADDTNSEAMLPYSSDHRSDQNITEMNITTLVVMALILNSSLYG